MKISENVKILKALADRSRLLIVNALFEKPQYVEELAERFDLANSTISFHLKKLESARLVYKIKEQYYVMYHIKDELFNLTLRTLLSFKDNQKSTQEQRISEYREKIVRSFFNDGKLIRLPSQHKKRWVVFEEILKGFKSGIYYTEKQVNEIIQQFHDDYCTIRRELIGERVMFRDNGRYWVEKPKLSFQNIEGNEQNASSCLQKSYYESIQAKHRGRRNKTMQTDPKKSNHKENDKIAKKQLKEQYRENQPRAGVYSIKNTVTSKKMIGSSNNVQAILNRYRFELSIGNCRNKELQKDWDHYGPDAFEFEILEYLDPEKVDSGAVKNALKKIEKKWIDNLRLEY